MLPKKYAFIDIETTGGSYFRDRIIEIGIIRVEDGQVVDTFSSLINPQTYIPEYIKQITGIDNQMVEDAPSFYALKERLLEILDGTTFVAHNVRFDYGFMRTEFKRLGITFSMPQLCTVRLSKALYPRYKAHNLDALIERFNLQVISRHRALDDAQAIWEFYQRLYQEFSPESILEQEQKISKTITTPINIPREIIDNLPESPGVYIFYDENNTPLYVGKSVDIKNRVLSHFRADSENSKELRISQQIHAIETIETVGELGALLKEASLIKELLPLHNRMLRRQQKLNLLLKTQTQGLNSVQLSVVDKIEADQISNVLGVFRSKKSASEFLNSFSLKYALCKKALGIENGKGFCFDYHLERCKGVCGGEENTLLYNLRFDQAFAQEHLKPWPFAGPIAIKEENPVTQKVELFVIDKWCFLGNIKYGETTNENLNREYNFDLDLYKILLRYLTNKNSANNIMEVQNFEMLTNNN